jgi:hypothetical protein
MQNAAKNSCSWLGRSGGRGYLLEIGRKSVRNWRKSRMKYSTKERGQSHIVSSVTLKKKK